MAQDLLEPGLALDFEDLSFGKEKIARLDGLHQASYGIAPHVDDDTLGLVAEELFELFPDGFRCSVLEHRYGQQSQPSGKHFG